MATNEDDTRNVLELLPPEILKECLGPFEPNYAEPDGIHNSDKNLNPNSDILLAIASSGDTFSWDVQQAALEATYTNITINYANDLNRLLRIFGHRVCHYLGREVRRIVMPHTHLKTRPDDVPPTKFPSSPPESREASAPPSPSTDNSALVEESDTSSADLHAMLRTPLAGLLRAYFESINTTHLAGRVAARATDNVQSLRAWTNNMMIHSIFVPQLLRYTPGLQHLSAWGNGLGMMPAIVNRNNPDDETNSHGLHLTQLRYLTIGERVRNSSPPFSYLDLNGLLMHCAPNLKELQLCRIHRVIRTRGLVELGGNDNDGGAPSSAHDGNITTPPSLVNLETLKIFDFKFANKDLYDLMFAMPRPTSFEAPGLKEFDAIVSLLGTEKDLEYRDTTKREYLSGIVTCYDMVYSLLPWKDKLTKLRLVHGCHETGYAHLTQAWDYHLESALRKQGKKLHLGTSLLPKFEGLKELTISAHLFDLIYISPYIEKRPTTTPTKP